MKRRCSFVLILLVLLLAVSCSFETLEDKEGIVVPFSTTSTTIKGLSDMHISEFTASEHSNYGLDPNEYDGFLSMQLAEQTMSTLPVIPGLKVVKNSASIPDFEMYGFNCTVAKTVDNKDGTFIKYFINEKQKDGDGVDVWVPVGIIDYYYNKNTKHFSYREYNMLTINMPDPVSFMPETYGLLVIELDDIAVNNANVNQFQAGEVESISTDGTVTFAKNAFADFFHIIDSQINDMEGKGYLFGRSSFERRYFSIHMNGNQGKGGEVYSFTHPKGSIYSNFTDWSSLDNAGTIPMINNSGIGSDLLAFMNEWTGKNEVSLNAFAPENSTINEETVNLLASGTFGGPNIDTSELVRYTGKTSTDKLNLSALKALYKMIYGDAADLENKVYTSYEDFLSSGVSDKVDCSEGTVRNNMFVTHYSIKDKTGFSHSLQLWGNSVEQSKWYDLSTETFGQLDSMISLKFMYDKNSPYSYENGAKWLEDLNTKGKFVINDGISGASVYKNNNGDEVVNFLINKALINIPQEVKTINKALKLGENSETGYLIIKEYCTSGPELTP